MKSHTRLSLAIIRNNLYNGRFGDADRTTLEEITGIIQRSQTPFRKLMLQAIENANTDIEKKRFPEAGYELNAIHNLPVEKEDFSSWDKNWFYSAEVPNYIERVGPSDRGLILLRLVEEAKAHHETVSL